MGFPDTFVFKGSKIEIAKQIGNAVPPPLAAAIAEMVKAALDFDSQGKFESRFEGRGAESEAA